jgi:hypothetical protein
MDLLRNKELKNLKYDTAQSNSRLAAIDEVPPAISGQHRESGHRLCLLRTGKHVDKV